MGRQSQLMWVGVAGYWGCGVPMGYTLAFHTNLHLSGLWVGSLTGAVIVGKAAQMISCSKSQLVVRHSDQGCQLADLEMETLQGQD